MAFAVPVLALATTAIGVGASYASARQQNKAIEKAAKAQNRNIEATQNQLASAASLEKLKAKRAAAQVAGRLRVAAGEAGVGIGGTYGALLAQNEYDAGFNQSIIDENYANQLARVRSGGEANLAQLSAGVRNPFIDAFAGGISGFSTGLQIGQAGQDVLEYMRPSSPPPQVQPPTINA